MLFLIVALLHFFLKMLVSLNLLWHLKISDNCDENRGGTTTASCCLHLDSLCLLKKLLLKAGYCKIVYYYVNTLRCMIFASWVTA